MEDKLTFLRENWHWPVLVLVFLGLGLYGLLKPEGGAEDETLQQQQNRLLAAKLARVQAAPKSQTISKEQKTVETIESHLSKVEEEPTGEDAPVLLCAAGNLYRLKLRNIPEAIRQYERCLMEYPDWEGINRVYCNLAACYEQLGDLQNEQWVYKEILKKFPEDSQEYQFAKAQLGLP
jgi:tetratricopeptide (TPR) repeat protein